MSYFICKSLESTHFTIFKNASYDWSDWHECLEYLFKKMQEAPIQHTCAPLVEDTYKYLSDHSSLTFIEIPTLLTYSEFCNQYPEFFI